MALTDIEFQALMAQHFQLGIEKKNMESRLREINKTPWLLLYPEEVMEDATIRKRIGTIKAEQILLWIRMYTSIPCPFDELQHIDLAAFCEKHRFTSAKGHCPSYLQFCECKNSKCGTDDADCKSKEVWIQFYPINNKN